MTITSVAWSGSATREPSVQWNFTGTEYGYKLKVFTSAVVGGGGFNPDTSTSVYSSVFNAPHGAAYLGANPRSATVLSPLPDGTFYAYVQELDSTNTPTGSWVQSGSTYVISDPPTVGTVTPAASATVTTDLPTLTAVVNVGAYAYPARVKGQWQVASDSGFTTNLKTITDPDTDLATTHTATMDVDSANQLHAGTWYVRGRAVDEFGTTSAWSAGQSFTVSHPPSASNLAPASNLTVDWGGAGSITFSWIFGSTSPVDTQTGYQIIVERNDTGAAVLDTGAVTSTAQSAALTIPSTYKDVVLRWKIRLTDRDSVTGSYSSYATFVPRDKPTVTITAPAAAGTVTTPSPTVTWTFAAGGGRTQAAWKVDYIKAGNIIYTASGTGTTATYTPPTGIYANGDAATATVTLTDSSGLSNSATVNFTVSFTPPANPGAPTVVTTNFDSLGYNALDWSSATVDGNFYSWRVYSRLGTSGTWKLLKEITAYSTTSYNDYLGYANQQMQYLVTQVALRFGTLVESVGTPTTVTPAGNDYWLIHPTDSTKNVHLSIVKSDDYSEEFEQETLKLIGRGRKKDYGTRWGWVGTIEAVVWDDSVSGITARQMKQSIETLREQLTYIYLRNPFGDLWQVGTDDIAVSRVAGVGLREFCTVTIPYQEVS